MSNETNATRTHKFEAAGLGVAPFKFVGAKPLLFQAIPGDPNCPIQAGGSCDYCSQAISYACYIQDANGKRFKVGSDCVAKTGDAGLAKAAKSEANRLKAEAQKERETARIAAALETLKTRREIFEAFPHPKAWAAEKGQTLADSLEWMFEHAGHTGKMKVTRQIEKFLKSRGE